jgi:hypothetical protein
MWYNGDIGSAIATVQKESKILLVFGMGDDPVSSDVNNIFEKASKVVVKIV